MKHAKSNNSHYSSILPSCMNIPSGKEKYGNAQIVLGNRNSSTSVMGKLRSKLKQEVSSEITMLETQSVKFTTSKKVNTDFCLPELSATKIVLWTFHVDKKETCSSPICHLRSHFLVYIGNHLYIVGIAPILNK